MFINGLNRDFSLLVKRTGMEWETMPTPDLVNGKPALLYSNESPPRKVAKILTLPL